TGTLRFPFVVSLHAIERLVLTVVAAAVVARRRIELLLVVGLGATRQPLAARTCRLHRRTAGAVVVAALRWGVVVASAAVLAAARVGVVRAALRLVAVAVVILRGSRVAGAVRILASR